MILQMPVLLGNMTMTFTRAMEHNMIIDMDNEMMKMMSG